MILVLYVYIYIYGAFQRISINADLGDNLLTHFVFAPACILHLCFYWGGQTMSNICALPDSCSEICPPGILCKQNDCMHMQLDSYPVWTNVPKDCDWTPLFMQWLTQFWKIPKLASLISLCTYGRGALLGWTLATFLLRMWISSSQFGCRPSHLGKDGDQLACWKLLCLFVCDFCCRGRCVYNDFANMCRYHRLYWLERSRTKAFDSEFDSCIWNGQAANRPKKKHTFRIFQEWGLNV